MEISKGTKVILLIVAALLIVGAVLINGKLTVQSPYRAVVDELTSRGYTMTEDDLYSMGSFNKSSIADVLAGQDLSQAVEASINSGFPSDINAVGDINMLLLTMESGDIITIFLRDGEMELCFVQRLDGSAVRPLE